nr:tyrosine-type recombinase/integrase [Lachnospiraceae bacterium]
MPERKYSDNIDLQNELKLRELMKTLPGFCRDYFIGIQPTTSTRTRLSYAYDLAIFFDFIHKNNPIYSKIDITQFPISLLDELKVGDIEEYLSYLRIYEKDGVAYSNNEKGIKRKLSSLRSMYNFLYRTERISSNPAEMVKTPKLHEKAITRLDIDEVATLLDQVETGEKLTKRQLMFHEQTKTRDLAMMTLLLGTGIRVSECVGLDIDDVDKKNDAIKIKRKGGNEAIIYFGEEVADALYNYMDERAGIEAVDKDKNALF